MSAIWYVHGAGAGEASFTYLRAQLPPHTAKYLTYDNAEPIHSSARRLAQRLREEEAPAIVIGHSMGGIIARATASQAPIARLITLCAPFGGVKHAEFLSMFNRSPMFSDLRQYSSLLIDLRARRLVVPHLAVVATRGLPHLGEANDGVVTLASQTALHEQTYTSFALNHFEVLLSPAVAATITSFLTS